MGLHEVVAYTLVNLGLVLGHLGAFDDGRKVLVRALEAGRKHHHPRLEGFAHVYRANLERLSGNVTAAEHHAQAAIAALSNVPPLLALAYAVSARALFMQGRADDGVVAAQEAHTLLESLGTIEEGEVTVRLVYAEALAASGNAAESARVLERAREHVMAKASQIPDATERERFLVAIADNARVIALATSTTNNCPID